MHLCLNFHIQTKPKVSTIPSSCITALPVLGAHVLIRKVDVGWRYIYYYPV